MTEQQTPPKRPLFRPEAVEAHARARVVTGGRLDLRERRTTWLFRGLLIGIALAVLLAFTIHVDRTVSAPAFTTGPGRVEFALPGRQVDSVRVGQEVVLRAGGGEFRGRVTEVVDARGAVLVRADVAGAPTGAEGRASVQLGRRSVAEQLVGRT